MSDRIEELVQHSYLAKVSKLYTGADRVAYDLQSDRCIFGNPDFIHDLQSLTASQAYRMTMNTEERRGSNIAIKGFGYIILLLKSTNGETKIVNRLVWYAPGYSNIIGKQLSFEGVLSATDNNQTVFYWGTDWFIPGASSVVPLEGGPEVFYIPNRCFVKVVPKTLTPSVNSASASFTLMDVYTYGACKNNHSKGPRHAGVGMFFRDGDDRNKAIHIKCDDPTSQIAELIAIREVLMCIILTDLGKTTTKYRINTDSRYAIDCVTRFFRKWEETGWKNSNRKPVKNSGLIKKCLEYISVVNSCYEVRGWGNIEFVLVFGQSHGNEMADALANDGCSEHYEYLDVETAYA